MDAAYQDFCSIIKKVPKKTISRGYRNNYITCWGAECKSLYRIFLQFPWKTTRVWPLKLHFPNLTGSGGIDGPRQFTFVTTSLAKFDRSGGIDGPRQFHTLVEKHKAYRTTLLVGHDTLLVTVPFQPMLLQIASQLVRKGRYEAVDCKSSRFVLKKCDLCRANTPDPMNISENFSRREFTAALQHLKPGKAPGSDFICTELIIHAGAALKSWLRHFLFPVCADSKFPKFGERL